MKSILTLVLSLAAVLPVLANDGVFYATGNTLIPVKETVIRMDKEILSLKRNGEFVEVNVYFEFFNPGPEKTETVGFVTPPAGGDIGDEEASHPQIENFTVTVNGTKLDYEVFRVEGSGFQLGEKVAMGDDFIYHFKTRFKPGLNKIVHTYAFRASHGVDLTYGIDYRLTTGAMWAGGKIADFTLNIEMAPNEYFALPWSFSEDGSPADWKLEGKGRLGIEPKEMFELKMRTVRLVSGKASLHVTDFKPERDLFVNVYPLYTSVGLWMDVDGFTNDFTEHYTFLSPWRDEEDVLTPLTKDELRYLRNFGYAWAGYTFKSKDLDTYFRRYNWYVPLEGLAMDKIKLEAHIKKLVDEIAAEEKRRGY